MASAALPLWPTVRIPASSARASTRLSRIAGLSSTMNALTAKLPGLLGRRAVARDDGMGRGRPPTRPGRQAHRLAGSSGPDFDPARPGVLGLGNGQAQHAVLELRVDAARVQFAAQGELAPVHGG